MPAINHLIANILANDIFMVTGIKPAVTSDLLHAKGNAILISTADSALAKTMTKLDLSSQDWESYQYKFLKAPRASTNAFFNNPDNIELAKIGYLRSGKLIDEEVVPCITKLAL